VRTQREISQGKLCILHSDFAGFTLAVHGMAIGSPRLMPGCPTTLALYPVSVRRIRVGGIGFLQIPPHDGHPCLALQFGPSPPAEDLHLLKAKHTWHTKKAHRLAPVGFLLDTNLHSPNKITGATTAGFLRTPSCLRRRCRAPAR